MTELAALGDDLLVARATRGDREALVALYRRYADEVYGYLYNQLGSADDAEDVTSETFLRLVRAIDTFRGGSSFRTWLYAIARNQLRDHWRRNGRHAEVALDLARAAADEAEVAPANPRASALGRAVLEALPENYRRVLELRIMQGRSVRDTAEALDLTPGNVKVLQHRALRRAAQIAEGMGHEG